MYYMDRLTLEIVQIYHVHPKWYIKHYSLIMINPLSCNFKRMKNTIPPTKKPGGQYWYSSLTIQHDFPLGFQVVACYKLIPNEKKIIYSRLDPFSYDDDQN